MNKVININLGGYPFMVDEDAYQKLGTYLLDIKRHFAPSLSSDEIVSDIESRMAELLMADISKTKPIVSLQDLETVIAVMGTPTDFGDADEEVKSSRHTASATTEKKRLYRNPDEKVIAGVASGVSAYFGIDDPIWIRLAFVVTFFTGLGPIPYIIFWIALPKATSAHDKLLMRGQEVNISSIAKTIENEIVKIGDSISEIGKGMKSKKNFKSF